MACKEGGAPRVRRIWIAAASRRPRDERHARRVVADIGGRATGLKPGAGELCDHRRPAIAREPGMRAQPPANGEQRAQETDDGCTEKAARRGKATERPRISDPGNEVQ